MTGIDRLVTRGTFSLDGGTWDVENNVWIIGDDSEVIVIDPAHDADAIVERIAGRRVAGIACTHAHDDHINQAPRLAELVDAPILLHPHDLDLWALTHPNHKPDSELYSGQWLRAGSIDVEVLFTPGHSRGSICLHAPELGRVFTGDTLFQGGPGATGRSFSSFDSIIHSIADTLLPLPPETVVHTGHGSDTSIGAEAPRLGAWIDRGH
nr:MBL fold metallo-hydrolase [Cryptosporangium phraense]